MSTGNWGRIGRQDLRHLVGGAAGEPRATTGSDVGRVWPGARSAVRWGGVAAACLTAEAVLVAAVRPPVPLDRPILLLVAVATAAFAAGRAAGVAAAALATLLLAVAWPDAAGGGAFVRAWAAGAVGGFAVLSVPLGLLIGGLADQRRAWRAEAEALRAGAAARADELARQADELGSARTALQATQTACDRQRREIDDYQSSLRALVVELTRVEERERRRIAAHLHDDVGQLLAAAQIRLERLADDLQPPAPQPTPARGDAAAARDLGAIRDLLEEAVSHTRQLTLDLCPPILYEVGLAAALRWLSAQVSRRTGLAVEVVAGDDEVPPDPEVRLLLFEAARELLANVAKHAGARRAVVSLVRRGDALRVTVADDGVGPPAAAAGHRSRAKGGGFGLFNIRERVKQFGGTFDLGPNGRCGTKATVEVPGKLAPATAA